MSMLYGSPPQTTLMPASSPPSATSMCYAACNFHEKVNVDTFDMMISYSWANKEISRQIFSRLQKDGYRVWIDQNEMHGSIIERMAEGIEKSSCVLLCMSSGYKKSGNCQAEAEYAFSRHKTIVPLLVEQKYKADGWLGFIIGNRLYINFTDKNKEFEAPYNALIMELERNGLMKLDETTNSEYVKHQSHHEDSKEESPTLGTPDFEQVAADNRYLTETQTPISESSTIAHVNDWKEQNVVEFLIDQNLSCLLTTLKGIDGQGLLELYRVYELSPHNLYEIFHRNDPTISPGIFFKFTSVFKNFLTSSE